MSQIMDVIDILTQSDREKYNNLRLELSSEKNKYQRFHRVDAFDKTLEMIKDYCIRGDDDDWKRCMVCGVCWTNSCIGVNVKQLMKLTGKSKSNINGVLSKMGYIVNVTDLSLKRELINAIPFLKGNYLEQRFWTTRVNTSLTPLPNRTEVKYEEPKEASKTPQPIRNQNIEVPGSDGLKGMFDVFSFEIGNNECGSFESSDLDFFSDPACCCPTEWFLPSSKIQSSIITYA